jgi:hypothetical protein
MKALAEGYSGKNSPAMCQVLHEEQHVGNQKTYLTCISYLGIYIRERLLARSTGITHIRALSAYA